jgi:YVTN family beta-propeller protein
MAFGQSINTSNWGTVTAPVYNQSESNPNYSRAEILAGPNKFGSYYAGVLPNGRKVTPAGNSIQIGMNPLGVALTPDGKFLVSSNDDEREGGFTSYQSGTNLGGYSLTVVDTSTFAVVSQLHTAVRFFIGLQITGPADGPYTVWAAGGPDNDVKLFSLSGAGVLTTGSPASIAIPPTTPSNQGFVTNYIPGPQMAAPTAVPSGFSRTGTTRITFPAGLQLSPDGKYLYVACNGDNSVAIIDTSTKGILKQLAAGAFPYAVAVNSTGDRIAVSNWGIMQYKFANATYDPGNGQLTALGTTGANTPDGFYVPPVSRLGKFPLTSSIHVYSATSGFASLAAPKYGRYLGTPLKLDANNAVGDVHPSAMAIVKGSDGTEVLFVAKTNDDSLARVVIKSGKHLTDYNLGSTFVSFLNNSGSKITLAKGAYPNAIAVSPDNTKLFVAEAGINSVAVLDVTDPLNPSLLGRIPTGWYPTALAVSADGSSLYIANAKGVGEDVNPAIDTSSNNPQVPPSTGLASDGRVDSNYIFGSLQKVSVAGESAPWDNTTVLANNFAVQQSVDSSVVPMGGTAGSARIKTVIFIMHENKTFDSMLGDLGSTFGNFAGTTFNNIDGSTYSNVQYTGVSLNTQALASTFATAVNYYSDSEESDAGHQFFSSGTATDYTEKTLLVKGGRGLLVNKNFEPEDYPEGGYIFNNLSRWKHSFKNYGMMVRIEGTDTGTNVPTTINDPLSGNVGYPQMTDNVNMFSHPVVNAGDVSTNTQGLGQTFFMKTPALGVLGTTNPNGTSRMDMNYPAYNFNISDQRRAQEFIKDFDGMVAAGTVPQFLFIYQPNDHTGGIQVPNTSVVQSICGSGGTSSCSGLQQIGDGDVGLGMVVQHIMKSPIYYNAEKNTGAAIFVSYDDAQSSLDHVHPHRTPMIVVSPFAKPGAAYRHYVTASIVKTGELLMGIPANNFGDLFATDLRDMFQSTYNGITADQINFNLDPNISPSKEGKKIWALVNKLDTSAPDRDSRRLGVLIRLSIKADQLHEQAEKAKTLETASYQKQQSDLYEEAVKLTSTAAPADNDD